MKTKPKLVLFDASGYIHRAFHALPPLTTSKGEPVGAIFGFSRMISKVLKSEKPDYVGVCFDTAAATFRHEQFADYKATRAETDTALVAQLPLCYELADAWGLPCIKKDGFEADDVIATLARLGRENGCDVLILSGDKDILQLVDASIHVRDEIKKVEYDEAKVIERYGVKPEQVVDVLSLMGDKVDNVPGVPGVGEKTASKLIAEHGTIEKIYENMNGATPSLKENLLKFKDEVLRNRTLIRLDDHVALDVKLPDLKVRAPHMPSLAPLLTRLEFRGELYGLETQELPSNLKENTTRRVNVVLTDADFDRMMKTIRGATLVGYDLETTGLDVRHCDIVGVALSSQEHEAWYIPVSHSYLGVPAQLKWDRIKSGLKEILEKPGPLKCGQNIKFDNTILERHGVTPQPPFFDTMIAAYCLDPSRPGFGLKDLAGDLLGEKMTRIDELMDVKEGNFAQVEIEKAAPYAAADAEVVVRLTALLKEKLKQSGLTELFEKMEMPLIEVIQAMEKAGIAIDPKVLTDIRENFQKKQQALEKEIFEMCGEEFLLSSPKQLSQVLFEKMKLPAMKKTKTGYSTDEKVLQKLSKDYPVCAKIIDYRELAKLTSTYIDALLAIKDQSTGRIHTSFNQTGTATGRLSSSEPNLQNIPIRSENGREIRKAFVAEKGSTLLSADYSQIDLRALAHMSEDPALVEAFRKGGDIHTTTAADVFHVAPDQVTKDMRRKAKAINFGIVYGQQAFGLSQALEIPVKEAQEFIDRYFERYAGVKVWIEKTLEEARKNKMVTTISGRRRLLPDINSSNQQIRGFAERVAMNTPIQGSSADIIKAAMIRAHAVLSEKNLKTKMLLQVHDELLFEVPLSEYKTVAPLMREAMENAYTLRVPLVVDMKHGPNWNDMEAA